MPDEAVRPLTRGDAPLWANPIRRNVEIVLNRLDRVGAGEAADCFAGFVEDVERYWRPGVGAQSVVDDRTIGGIFARRLFGRQGRIGVLVAAEAIGKLRLEEKRPGARCLRVELAKRSHVVEDPE